MRRVHLGLGPSAHRPAVVLMAALVLGCTHELDNTVTTLDTSTEARHARGPLIGAGTGDSPDRSCQVLLHDAGRVAAGDAWVVRGASWVFEARVDVSRTALQEGVGVALLARAAGPTDAPWHVVAPDASDAIDTRFERFLFTIDADSLGGARLSGPDAEEGAVELIPYLSLGDARVFDHNRLVDASAAYALTAHNGFAVAEDTTVCSAASGPTLTFAGDWTETQDGPVVGGRTVTVAYDIARLPGCRQTYNGSPTWSVVAHARFLPMNLRASLGVVDHQTSPAQGLPATFFVPEGATSMHLWFDNSDRAGCQRYDSNYGENYVFTVERAPASSGPSWMGNAVATLSRAASRRCEGASAFTGPLVFGTWARQRAAITDLCFEAYEAGLTDVEEPELWRLFDARVHYRFGADQPFSSAHVPLVGRVGNNARYAFDLRGMDPFMWGRCLDGIPVTRSEQVSGDTLRAEASVYFTINGRELRPAPNDTFRVVYEDYADAPRVTCGE